MRLNEWPKWLTAEERTLIDTLVANGVGSEVEYEMFRYNGDPEVIEQLDTRRFKYFARSPDYYDPLKILKNAPFWMREIEIKNFSTSVRLRNVFSDTGIETIGHLLDFSTIELLSLRNMGRKSLSDLSNALLELSKNRPNDYPPISRETPQSSSQEQDFKQSWFFLMVKDNPGLRALLSDEGIEDELTYLQHKNSLSDRLRKQIDDYRFKVLVNLADQDNPIAILEIAPSWLLNTEVEFFPCPARIKNIASRLDIDRLHDFLKFDFFTLRRMPNMGIKSLREFANAIVLAQDKGPPPTLENPVNFDETLYECLLSSINSLADERHRYIILNRFGVGCPPITLEEIGTSLNITRERVRQIQKKVTQAITDGEYWDDSLKFKILRRFNEKNGPIILEEIVEVDPWFSEFQNQMGLLKRVIEHFANLNLHLFDVARKTVISKISKDEWDQCEAEVLSFLEHSLDMNYSFEDVELIIEHQLAKYDAAELTELLFDEILRVLNFSNFDGESVLVNIGNSISNRLNVVLEESDTPLHYSKAKLHYEERYGIVATERQIHSALSHYNFHLFDRGVFGVLKHLPISLERLAELVEQAEQLANEKRSKQWHTSELLRKLVGLQIIIEHEGVDKYVLNIGLQISSKLKYLGKMVWICDDIENVNVPRIQLKDAIPVIIRDNGGPMTVREIVNELKKSRGVGYDITQQLYLSDLIAKTDPGRWGLLSRDFEKPLSYWSYIKSEILDHLSACGQAVHKSEIIEVLSSRGVSELPKINLLLGIISSDEDFRTWPGGFFGMASQDNPNRLSLSQALAKVLSSTDIEFTTNEIMDSLSAYVSFPYNKSQLSRMINDCGFQYELETGYWTHQNSQTT